MTQCKHTHTTTRILDSFDASGILGSPFSVFVKDTIKQNQCSDCGSILSNTIPNPENLLAVTAILRALNPRKLNGEELKFLRKSLCKKSKDMATRLEIDPATYSRYENNAQPIGEIYEKLLRADVCLHHLDSAETVDVDVRDILNMDILSAHDVCKPLSFVLVRDALNGPNVDLTKWKNVA